MNGKLAREGDIIQFRAEENIFVGNLLIVPKGATGEATIVKIKHASNFGRDGRVDMDFKDLLTIDYIAQHQFPVILVTSGRLGSINHTLLSLEALKHRGLSLHALVYNLKDESKDPLISEDTADYLKAYLAKHFPEAEWIELQKF